MNEQIVSVKNGIRPFIIGFMFGVFCMFAYTSTRGNEGAISEIKEQQQRINYEINSVGVNINDARQTVAGANKRVDEMQGNVDKVRAGLIDHKQQIDSIASVVRECKSLAEENGAILKTIGE